MCKESVAATPSQAGSGAGTPVVLSGRQRRFVGAGVVFFLLAALILGLRTLAPAAGAALFIGVMALSPAARLRERWGRALGSVGVACGVCVLVLGVLLLGILPVWQRSADRYGKHVIGAVSGLSHRVLDAGDPDSGTAAMEKDGHEAWSLDTFAAQAREHTGRAGAAFVAAVQQGIRATEPLRLLRVRLFFQASLLTAFLIALPLLAGSAPAEDAGKFRRFVHSLRIRFSAWLVSGVGIRMAGRTVKAMPTALFVGLGAWLAGLDVGLFIAGCVFLLSFLFPRGGFFGLLLFLPVAPAAPGIGRALAVWVALGVVLLLGERRLHRRWAVQRAVHGDETAVPPRIDARNDFAELWTWARRAFSLALLVALGWAGYAVASGYRAERSLFHDLQDAWDERDAGRFREARHRFESIREQNPQDARAGIGLMTILAERGDEPAALALAEHLAQGPEPVTDSTLLSGARAQITRWALYLLSPTSRYPTPGDVYSALVRALPMDGSPTSEKALEQLVQFDPDNPWAALSVARKHLARNEPEPALARAHAGLTQSPTPDAESALYRTLAAAHIQRGEWEQAIEACNRGLERAPADPELQQKLQTAEAHRTLGERAEGPRGTLLQRRP